MAINTCKFGGLTAQMSYMSCHLVPENISAISEAGCEKTCLKGLRADYAQTSLISYTDQLDS